MREQIRVFQARRPIWLDVVYLVTAFAAVYFLWNSAQLKWLIYPLRLLVTFIHETSHALAAIVTGGELNEFVVNPDGSGFVSVSGGNPILIAPAGYLGTAILVSGCSSPTIVCVPCAYWRLPSAWRRSSFP